jgi:thiol-disulfide isomerase/thioredoxin
VKRELFAPIRGGLLRLGMVLAACLTIGIAAAVPASAAGAVLIAFSSPHCGPCQAMKPTLRQLEHERVPVRYVDVTEEVDFARRHGVRQTPTFVVWSAGKELTRLVGMQSADALRQALATNPSGPLFQTGASVDPRSMLSTAPGRTLAASPAAKQPPIEAMPSRSLADAVQRARAATVRLRVQEGKGFGVGTGTIIDRHGEEALVLTCGHLFRETKLEANIEVDLFVGGQVQTVPGQVIDYDAEDRDIALVVIRPGFDVQPVQIANLSTPPQTGQSVFSFGCDRGDDPSRRDTRITGVNKYNQHIKASNIEIAGAPIDGRSGGGLFNERGQLIGVCNAADYKGDVGIYTGPGSIRWQLDRIGLAHLYRGEASAVAAAAEQPAPPQPPALTAPAPPQPAPRHRGEAAIEPQTQLASLNSPGSPAAQPSGGEAMLVIVPDANRPGGKRVITIAKPTPELLQMIQRHGQ